MFASKIEIRVEGNDRVYAPNEGVVMAIFDSLNSHRRKAIHVEVNGIGYDWEDRETKERPIKYWYVLEISPDVMTASYTISVIAVDEDHIDSMANDPAAYNHEIAGEWFTGLVVKELINYLHGSINW